MRNLICCSAFLLLSAPACGKKEPPPAADGHHEEPGAPAHDHGMPPHEHGDDHHHDEGTPGHEHPVGHGGQGHAHGAPHGGVVKSIGNYHLEAVATKAGLLFFPLDADENELPLTGVSGKLTFVADGKEPIELGIEPMGNHLHAMVVLDGGWKAAVSVTILGESYALRFEGTGQMIAGMAESGHDHGAHGGMPVMALSDAVEAHVTADNLVAGQSATLHMRFDRKEPRAPVTDFETVHDKKLHVFIVSEDMSFYAHEHPEPADLANGSWNLSFTFPAPGNYRVYADFKSASLGPTVTMATVTVPGAPVEPKPLVADTAMTKTFEGLKVTLSLTPASLGVGDALIAYRLEDAATGEPVTDLEPYLGAFAHLFVLHQDLTSMAHAHPRGAEPTADSRGGPTLELHTEIPKPGLYKLWAQFKRGGKVITTDWVLQAR